MLPLCRKSIGRKRMLMEAYYSLTCIWTYRFAWKYTQERFSRRATPVIITVSVAEEVGKCCRSGDVVLNSSVYALCRRKVQTRGTVLSHAKVRRSLWSRSGEF